MAEQLGYRVTGTITAVKGECSWGHKVGQKFELSGYTPDGLCGFFYNVIYPYLMMLQFGGNFPEEWGDPETMTFDCPDQANAVTIELQRGK